MSANSTAYKSAIDHTPIPVQPRRMRFPFEQVRQRFFFDNNPLKSAYIAALSATFPAGEGEFIKSVRFYQDAVDDPNLLARIKDFVTQEGQHSQQHRQFNESLKQTGFDAVGIEKVFARDMTRSISKRSKAERLAFTVCFEHQTAVLADALLRHPHLLEGMDETIKSLLRWHSVEEIEHKSVAFDLYMATIGNRKMLRKAQKVATLLFSARVAKYMMLMLWWSRTRPSSRDIREYWQFMFGKAGLITIVKPSYKDFFAEDFHPWQHDNRDLIERWQANQEK